MADYVLAFRGQPDRQPPEGAAEAWGAWFGSLGPALADAGHRVETVRTLRGSGPGNGARTVLTGYIMITAEDDEAAGALASGCPGLHTGLSVDVAHAVEA